MLFLKISKKFLSLYGYTICAGLFPVSARAIIFLDGLSLQKHVPAKTFRLETAFADEPADMALTHAENLRSDFGADKIFSVHKRGLISAEIAANTLKAGTNRH